MSSIHEREEYLRARTGSYAMRRPRYQMAVRFMLERGLNNDHLVFDVGAGWTELDYCLRFEYLWNGRYAPVDGAIDGTDLNRWEPPRHADFFCCLEVLEHLRNPARLLMVMLNRCHRAVVCTVPNPRTVDVLGMDATHVSKPDAGLFRAMGFSCQEVSLYGKPADSLFAVYLPT